MNCRECEGHLQEMLDGGAPAANLDRHLAECPRCRDLHLAVRALESGLAALPRPALPPLLTRRIVERVVADRRRQLLLRRYRVAVAAAAAVMFVALSLLGHLFPPGTKHEPQIVKHDPPPKAPEPPAPSLRQQINEAGTAVAALTDRVASETRKHAELFWQVAAPPDMPPMPPVADMPGVDTSLDTARRSLEQTGSGVTTGLQPVSDSARRAIGFLVREIPDLKAIQ